MRFQEARCLVLVSDYMKPVADHSVCVGWGGGRLLYRGGNFACRCISTTPIGAPIYIWPRQAIHPSPPVYETTLFHIVTPTDQHLVWDHFFYLRQLLEHLIKKEKKWWVGMEGNKQNVRIMILYTFPAMDGFLITTVSLQFPSKYTPEN